MSLLPKVTCEDIRVALNGTVTGSTYYFWEQSISSGSLLAQLNLANYYLYGILGETMMDTSDTVLSFHIRTCELDYACMRVLTNLSGGVITDGFSWATGPIRVTTSPMLQTYTNLINQFKESAQLHLKAIQPMHFFEEADVPVTGKTATSVM